MLAAPLALALVVAACGSDDDSGDDTSTTEAPAGSRSARRQRSRRSEAPPGGDGLAAAQAVVDANLVATDRHRPDDSARLRARRRRPSRGSSARCRPVLRSASASPAAAELLGWNLEVVSWDTDAAAAFQQALDQGVDYVAITGTSPALIQDQLDQANCGRHSDDELLRRRRALSRRVRDAVWRRHVP